MHTTYCTARDVRDARDRSAGRLDHGDQCFVGRLTTSYSTCTLSRLIRDEQYMMNIPLYKYSTVQCSTVLVQQEKSCPFFFFFLFQPQMRILFLDGRAFVGNCFKKRRELVSPLQYMHHSIVQYSSTIATRTISTHTTPPASIITVSTTQQQQPRLSLASCLYSTALL